jgi:4-alpha-glucanotransferase
MNTPSTPQNNWTWRMAPNALSGGQAHGLAQLAEMTDRDGWVEPEKT